MNQDVDVAPRAGVDVPRADSVATQRGSTSRTALSVMQQRMWFVESMQEGSTHLNLCAGRRLRGPLNVDALERSIDALIARHGALRTMIRADDGHAPMQHVLAPVRWHLAPIEDLRALPQAERGPELDRRLTDIALQPVDLVAGPLFDCRLFRLGDEDHVLLFKMHHIVFDGWSLAVVLRDLGQLYAMHVAGIAANLPELAVSYADFVDSHGELMRSEQARDEVRYWTKRLHGLSESLALPADRARPRRPSNRAGMVSLSVDRPATDRLRELARAEGATLFASVLAAYFVFLSRTTAQTDLVVGIPVHGRRDFPETADVVGLFVNTIAMRVDVRPHESFRELLRRVGPLLREDLRHSHASLEEVLRASQVPRNESGSSLYQAFLSFQDIRSRTREWKDLQLEPYTVPITGIGEDLACTMVERADGLSATLAYSLDLFSSASASAFAERYAQLLEQLGADPDRSIETLDLTLPAERRRLAAWNNTPAPYDTTACVHAVIDAQAALRHDAVALHAGETTLTHGELAARSNQLARRLRTLGIGRGALVGLCVERSASMVVAQLAVLKSGAAYVPLDPAYPPSRLAYMANDAQLALLVTESTLAHTLDWPRERSILLDADAVTIDAEPKDRPALDAQRDARPEDPAYVIYTSGSTGQPKGVVVQHRAVVNFLASMARMPGMDALVRLVAVTTLSFDIAVLELLLPLTVGAQIVLAGLAETTDGMALRALIESSGANMMQATPGTWRALIEAGWQGSNTFKALIGGEGLPADLARQLLDRTGELWNMYGPTETTVWSTCWKVDGADAGISIGTPIANTQVHILDEAQNPCPIGVPGEIHIGGDGVTLGYLNRAELTAQRFIADPFGTAAGARLYRTGDRGRWRHDGLLEHMGRLDFQVKVRGHRIELGEIESNLATHPQVARTVVIVREDRPGDVRLVAYVVVREHMPSASELRDHLRANQPEFSLPQHFVRLDAIPFLPNGKIDRNALPAPADDSAAADPTYEPPRTDTEKAMAEIWQELLGMKRVSVTANFFDLGGHSMLAMRLVARVQQRFSRKLPLVALMENGSIRRLCASIEGPASNDSLVLIRPGGNRPAVFLVHDGLGETLLYRTLAMRLDAGHSIYGVQPHAADGHAMLHSRITDMAAHHVAKIRGVQPHGPYLLGGLCAGGVIAFEIARQLRALGEPVAMVALLDAADAASETRRGRTTAKRLRSFVGVFRADDDAPPVHRVMAGLGKAARKVWNVLSYEARTLVERSLTASKVWLLRKYLDRQRMPPAFLRGLSVGQIYQYALSHETTRGRFDGDVALFRATHGNGAPDDEPHAELFSDPLFGWGRHVQGAVHTFDIPGGHTSMLQDPHVGVLAAHMQACIDTALGPRGDAQSPNGTHG